MSAKGLQSLDDRRPPCSKLLAREDGGNATWIVCGCAATTAAGAGAGTGAGLGAGAGTGVLGGLGGGNGGFPPVFAALPGWGVSGIHDPRFDTTPGGGFGAFAVDACRTAIKVARAESGPAGVPTVATARDS